MSVRQAVEAVEADRLRRLIAGDWDGLAKLCDPRLDYLHSTGRRDNLASLLELLGSGAVRYNAAEHWFNSIESLGSAVWAAGRMRLAVRKDGEDRQLDTLTTTVWLPHEDSFRLLAFHATSAPVA